MEQRVSVITLGVSDVARSRRFYADGLGWRPVFENEEIVFYQLNGVVLGTWLRERLLAESHLPAGAGAGAVALAHNVRTREEVEPLLARAAAAGGTLLAPAVEPEHGGYTGYFADPDGHAWEVAWNPGWPIGPDGDVTARFG
jgi:catechol 2,3-dioxygenase-like lactoylglutathione lyase family enzyme